MSNITIRLDQTANPFKSIHGVNNGPVTYGDLVDVSDYYIKMGTPLVRLHDPNWPHPREVDIHILFPDFSKDPSDPASYDFTKTDEYIRTVLATGAKIVWRLGESIEHTKHKKYYVNPPVDYEKWAQICIGVIKHYNQGWANGFHYGIEYWEIWNEPDIGDKMWTGSLEQYYKLYEVAFESDQAIRSITEGGGPAAARPMGEMIPAFLSHCREKGLPLDFFSWHTYTTNPEAIRKHALHVRDLLDQYGFAEAESHLNEWNYLVANFSTMWDRGNELVRKEAFDRQKNEEGASFTANVLAILQDVPVDHANYYDGQPTALFCGLFDYHGAPQKTYYTFETFEKLRSSYDRVASNTASSAEGLYCLAGKDASGGVMAMISSFHMFDRRVKVTFEGADVAGKRFEVYAIDERRSCELAEAGVLSSNELELRASKYSVLAVTIR